MSSCWSRMRPMNVFFRDPMGHKKQSPLTIVASWGFYRNFKRRVYKNFLIVLWEFTRATQSAQYFQSQVSSETQAWCSKKEDSMWDLLQGQVRGNKVEGYHCFPSRRSHIKGMEKGKANGKEIKKYIEIY